MTPLPRVALLIESSRTYGRGVLRGIANYAHIHGPWSFFWQERELHSGIPLRLQQWQPDGIIARIDNRRMAAELSRLKVPVVDVLGNENYPGIFGFDTDAEAVARLAADFFVQAGFRDIAFCGYRGLPFSDRREQALAAHLARLGRRLLVCAPPVARRATHIQATEESGVATENAIAAWLRRQRRPLALLACNDVRAQQVLHTCRDHGLKVPEEVAVMGVDNDDVLCNLSDPPLTSIQPDTERLGQEAAALLHRLLRGQAVRGGPARRQIAPLAVVQRASTDVVPVEDPIVVQALRFIRDQLTAGIAVKDVLEAVGRSRTDLENRFRRHVHSSVRGEIFRLRLDRARHLLRETDLGVEEVAIRAGFNTASHLCRLFQMHLQTTPARYRLNRGGPRRTAKSSL